MDLTIFNTSDISETKKEAIELHYEIKKNGEFAAAAMVEFCKGLKKMRDNRLYSELGFDSFEEYVENAVGLKQRQAYTYIQALENLGESVLQSTAKFGITKLSLLCEIPRNDREDFIEQNDVEKMSTRELKDAVARATAAEEQLTFITEENEKLKKENSDLDAENDKYLDELDIAEGRIRELEKELEDEKDKPVQVSVREPSAEEIAKYTHKAVEAAKAEAAEEKKRALNIAKDENKKKLADFEAKKKKEFEDLELKYKSALATIEGEKNAAAEKLAEIEKTSKVTDNPEVLKFSFYFEEAQNNINHMRDIINKVDTVTAEKLQKALDAIVSLLKG